MSVQPEKKRRLSQPVVTLNTGATMPMLGYGTFLSEKGEVQKGVKAAIKVGYRHIDCAAIYGNEKEVGEALSEVLKDKSYGVDRKDLFITSKLWLADMEPSKVRGALEKSLKDLQLSYVDLYLVHVPFPKVPGKKSTGFGLQDTWRAMEDCSKAGFAKAIGVSNYPTLLVADCLNYAKIPPAVNQIERHPYLANTKLRDWCMENGVHITAYAPLGAPGLMKDSNILKDPVVGKLAAKYKKTAAQILIRYSVDSGVIVLAKSVKESRIKENFNVCDFELTSAEVKELDSLDKTTSGRMFLQEDHCSGFFW